MATENSVARDVLGSYVPPDIRPDIPQGLPANLQASSASNDAKMSTVDQW